jgi:hypothetical protein
MVQKVTIAVLLVSLLLATAMLAMSGQNGFCPPWLDRVSYGDGPLGPGEDYTACR